MQEIFMMMEYRRFHRRAGAAQENVRLIRVNVADRDGRFGATQAVGPRCVRLSLLVKLMLVDTHRDNVNGPDEMEEVLNRLFLQANLQIPRQNF